MWVAAVCTSGNFAIPRWSEACLMSDATEIATGGFKMLNKQVQIHHESLCSSAAKLPHLLSLVPTAVMPCSPRNFCINGALPAAGTT